MGRYDSRTVAREAYNGTHYEARPREERKMQQTLRKVVRYIALAALVVGLVLIIYGAIVNQVALNTFLALLNQGGFKAFLIGILLVVASLVLLVMSLFVGRGGKRKPTPAPAQASAPAPMPAPDEPERIES